MRYIQLIERVNVGSLIMGDEYLEAGELLSTDDDQITPQIGGTHALFCPRLNRMVTVPDHVIDPLISLREGQEIIRRQVAYQSRLMLIDHFAISALHALSNTPLMKVNGNFEIVKRDRLTAEAYELAGAMADARERFFTAEQAKAEDEADPWKGAPTA
jgi:hypothetical protein